MGGDRFQVPLTTVAKAAVVKKPDTKYSQKVSKW